MKRNVLLGLAATLCVLTLVSCASPTTAPASVQMITPQDAKARLDSDKTIILVDVRTQTEFDIEHIPGAHVAPVEFLSTTTAQLFPDKNATYFIYCRSGNRSATASRLLVGLGYQHVYDLGGIIDWPYETVVG
jgi:rhodanese-related sulfurtransferase